jgi:hypothetical protein
LSEPAAVAVWLPEKEVRLSERVFLPATALFLDRGQELERGTEKEFTGMHRIHRIIGRDRSGMGNER